MWERRCQWLYYGHNLSNPVTGVVVMSIGILYDYKNEDMIVKVVFEILTILTSFVPRKFITIDTSLAHGLLLHYI